MLHPLHAKGSGRRRALAAILLLGAAAGCTTMPAASDPFGAQPREVAPARSLVRMPEDLATRRLDIRRQTGDGRLRERVVLANDTALPFENRIEVETAWRGVGSLPFARELDEAMFPQAAIEKLVATEFRGAVVSPPAEASNRNGPYAYVTASYTDGPSCLYAWQALDRWASLDRTTHRFGLTLRYCAAKAAPAELLAMFDRLDVNAGV